MQATIDVNRKLGSFNAKIAECVCVCVLNNYFTYFTGHNVGFEAGFKKFSFSFYFFPL